MLVSIILILAPYILTVFIYFNYDKIHDEKFNHIWGTFFEEFSIDRGTCGWYYVLFFGRRLVIAAGLILMRKRPLVQILSAELACFGVLAYMLFSMPFRTKLMNYVQIVNEMCILSAYWLCGLFYFEVGWNEAMHGWLILGCMYTSYLLHFGVLMYNLGKFIVRTVQRIRQIVTFRNFMRHFFRRRTNSTRVH